jgi:hypothetical protein
VGEVEGGEDVAAMVRIVNPAEIQEEVEFAISSQPHALPAGKAEDFPLAAGAVIEFDRGNGDEIARYSLGPGVYTFAVTAKGLELFRTSDAGPVAEAN